MSRVSNKYQRRGCQVWSNAVRKAAEWIENNARAQSPPELLLHSRFSAFREAQGALLGGREWGGPIQGKSPPLPPAVIYDSYISP